MLWWIPDWAISLETISLTVGGCVIMRIDYFSDIMFLISFTEVKKSSSFWPLGAKTHLDILVIHCCFWMLMNSSPGYNSGLIAQNHKILYVHDSIMWKIVCLIFHGKFGNGRPPSQLLLQCLKKKLRANQESWTSYALKG